MLPSQQFTPANLGITREFALGRERPLDKRRGDLRYDLVKKFASQGKRGEKELLGMLGRAMATDADHNTVDLARSHWLGPRFTSRILDTTSTYGGNILPRVDIEDYLYALFVTQFPLWDRLRDGPANGLNHTWNIISASGQSSVTDAVITIPSDTSVATADTSQYAQKSTSNIATFLEQRGVTIKEEAAVAQSGMTYNPETQELEDGLTRLKDAIQRILCQGDQSVSSGAGANTELGAYNANGFDGFRIITGGLGSYNGASVRIDQDLAGKTIQQAINTGVARVDNNGGMSSLVVMSSTAHAALMDEQEGKQRAVDKTELIPGVMVRTVNTVRGDLPITTVPGLNAIGQYARTSDGKQVEDIYVLDERTVWRRWLGSRDINVLEIPAGVSGALTRTFLIFHFCTLEVADLGLWQAKVRIPQTLT